MITHILFKLSTAYYDIQPSRKFLASLSIYSFSDHPFSVIFSNEFCRLFLHLIIEVCFCIFLLFYQHCIEFEEFMKINFCIPIWITLPDPPFQDVICSVSTKGLKTLKIKNRQDQICSNLKSFWKRDRWVWRSEKISRIQGR